MDAVLIRRLQRRRHRRGGLPALRFAIVGITALLFSALALAATGALMGVGLYNSYVQDLPSAEEIGRRSVETFETTRIYDRTGQHLLYEIIPSDGGRRTEVPLSRIPEHLRNATIAMEDKTFYTNPGGINVEGLARAVWGVLTDQDLGGGSSITQQLVRNIIMTPEERADRSYLRKLKEVILANELTQRYPGVEGRDKILEWYLNNIFYGHFAYGVEAAAQTYFKKPVEELTLAEAAMVVQCGQSPARNPIDAPEEAKRYQETVLDQMYLQGYITAEEAYAAKQEPLVIAPVSFDIRAPHYVMYVRSLLEQRFGSQAVYGGGLQVITAIDLEAQAETERVARAKMAEYRETYNARGIAIVVIDAKTAEIRAMLGSLDYYDKTIDGQINMAISPRQPGSSFKPFTYATAFAQGYTPATMVMDVRTSFPDYPNPAPYVPENVTRSFSGPMLLRHALAGSHNVPAVAMLHKVGVPSVLETAHAMGITTLNKAHYGLALTLGGGDVTLLDMVYAYSVFANGGAMLGAPILPGQFQPGYRQLNPVAILRVTDASGKMLYEYKEPQRREVLQPEVAFLITDILSDNHARTHLFGPESALKLGDRPAAVKTGTTNDARDTWTIGYTTQYVTGVWIGNTDYQEMLRRSAGSTTAAPVWNELMTSLHKDLPIEAFPRPDGLETAVIDAVSGKLPTEYTTARRQELFIKGTVPTEHDDVHQPFRICTESGKLATVYCPPEHVQVQVFDIYPSEADDWIREKGIPQPPKDFCEIHGPNLNNADVAIVSPLLMGRVREVVQVLGNVRPGGLERYWLEYGQGMTPSAWTRIGDEYGHRVDNGVLAHWDTKGLQGLYTLQLSVVAGGGMQRASVPVLVDNISPTVAILYPQPDEVFTMDKDEWIHIQVLAQDDIAMDRVEFFLNDQSLGYTTVAPYNLRWTISMSNTQSLRAIDLPRTPFGTIDDLQVTLEEGEDGAFSVKWPSGRGVISNSGGYTETHTVHVVVTDAAGNVTKSDSVMVQVIPKPKEEDKPTR